jgi:hypothetical protein
VEEEEQGYITCATYTHARRHPMVLGKIGGWKPPFQVTLPQLGVFILVFLIEIRLWRFWAAWMSPIMAIGVALIIPGLASFLVRRARVEGRSLVRAVIGWASFLLVSTHRDRVGGRTYRPPRPGSPGSRSVYVAAAEVYPS